MTALLDAIRSKTDRALASGDLSPLETSETVVEQNGLRFIVRWAEALARKDAAKAAAPATAPAPAAGADAVILPGGPRDPNFNPFLNPDPALTVGPIGTQHTIVLNKFPVCLHHLVLARRDFAEQLTPLELCDFEVLAQLLCTLGGLGFYNGGAPAGASQRHKHVQWVPAEPGNASLAQLAAGLSADAQPGVVYRHPALPMAHACSRWMSAWVQTRTPAPPPCWPPTTRRVPTWGWCPGRMACCRRSTCWWAAVGCCWCRAAKSTLKGCRSTPCRLAARFMCASPSRWS